MRVTTLVLLRHAKAARPDDGPDFDRPLTTRGHGDAAAAGAWLRRKQYIPDVVLCSPARRTRQTWHAVAVALADAARPEVTYRAEIYESGAPGVLALLHDLGEHAGTVLLVGHNPTVSDMSALLAPAAVEEGGLRTSGIAVHRPRVPWARLGAGDAVLVEQHTPRAG
ncbi:phosphoglycerate mutase [Pilimelia anulata]|uniref:Phosphoglycerate mutase n=1 Tax=Pilimelia anulata TaxID=53371 RepID=A0A8J3B6R4_9ACTN|nr:histidine phosphatase family protein [Pilimelia anulata]GGJ89190.1 phosphoglycerate mutase [Pilimelia anulata]